MRAKRAFDITLATVLLVLTAPLWPFLALAIRLESHGPILYRARRIGRAGAPFTMFKLRTMLHGPSIYIAGITGANDTRVTRVGRFLRAARLDELPQLWNVLRGEMSFVGPRPEDPRYVDLDDVHWREVLSVPPGITGLAQITYRNEAELLTGPDIERQYREDILPRKLEIDCRYVKNWTFWGDVQLLFKTLFDLNRLRRSVDRLIFQWLRLHAWTFTRDAAIIVGAYALGMCVRFDLSVPASDIHTFLLAIPFIVGVYSATTYLFGIHRRMWRYAGMTDLRAIIIASGLSIAIVAAGEIVIPGHRPVPLSVVLAGGTFALLLLTAVRVRGRLAWKQDQGRDAMDRILIVGAGNAGQLLVRALRAEHGVHQIPVGFVDDDPRKQRMIIHGVPVLGPVQSLPAIAAAQHIDVIGIAVPSATQEQLDRFLALAQQTEARIQILPSLAEITTGKASVRLRSIRLEDLLERVHVTADDVESVEWLENRVVLVTGAAGSIGSELCRQLLSLRARRVIALDNNETALFHLENELSGAMPGGRSTILIPVLADITDMQRLQRVFRQHGPDVIFHTAAYKHVPMLETYPQAAVVVNIVGTQNLCRLATAMRCERFVFISTDKAVHPQNALGYSKRIGELLTQAQMSRSDNATIFASVRFGNVLGSRGSALPEFIRQIDEGGPVTVTHPEAERYFLTLSEAGRLIIQAGALGSRENTLFMLDMGEPIRILDLVHRLIRLRGLRPGKDIQIVHTGLRPGEKLTEELVFSYEDARPTRIPGVHAICGGYAPSADALEHSIALLQQIARQEEPDVVIAALAQIAREAGAATGHLESVS